MVWYGGCYTKNPKDDFPKSGKESGGYWEVELEEIYENGRTGDHMRSHFQCDLCHFRNIKGRGMTNGSYKYEILITAIRRASLDGFWSREPGTVRGNLKIMRNMGKIDR